MTSPETTAAEPRLCASEYAECVAACDPPLLMCATQSPRSTLLSATRRVACVLGCGEGGVACGRLFGPGAWPVKVTAGRPAAGTSPEWCADLCGCGGVGRAELRSRVGRCRPNSIVKSGLGINEGGVPQLHCCTRTLQCCLWCRTRETRWLIEMDPTLASGSVKGAGKSGGGDVAVAEDLVILIALGDGPGWSECTRYPRRILRAYR
eukprot:3452694-Prymnesium_polylepis.4